MIKGLTLNLSVLISFIGWTISKLTPLIYVYVLHLLYKQKMTENRCIKIVILWVLRNYTPPYSIQMSVIFTMADAHRCERAWFNSFHLCWQIWHNEGAVWSPLLQSTGWMSTSQIEYIIQFIRRRKGRQVQQLFGVRFPGSLVLKHSAAIIS